MRPLALTPRDRMSVTVGQDTRVTAASAPGHVTPPVGKEARVVLLISRVSVTSAGPEPRATLTAAVMVTRHVSGAWANVTSVSITLPARRVKNAP